MMLGNAPGKTTSHTTRNLEAPRLNAARCRSVETDRTPNEVFKTIGKRTVYTMTSVIVVKLKPNHTNKIGNQAISPIA